ncbi:MAG: aromatic amino acid lyase [Chlamydiia bacterium]|nr:aromatic amino acid lyase [Chlamydiia bacterium]
MVKLDGESLTLKEAKQIANGAKLSLDKGVRGKVEAARKCVLAHLKEGKRVYGVTTGFGYLARCDVDKRRGLPFHSMSINSNEVVDC